MTAKELAQLGKSLGYTAVDDDMDCTLYWTNTKVLSYYGNPIGIDVMRYSKSTDKIYYWKWKTETYGIHHVSGNGINIADREDVNAIAEKILMDFRNDAMHLLKTMRHKQIEEL